MEPEVGHTDRVDGARQKRTRVKSVACGLLLLLISAATITQSARSHYIAVSGEPPKVVGGWICPYRYSLSVHLVARVCFVAETKGVVVDLRSDDIKGIALTADEYFALDAIRDSVVEVQRNGTEKSIHHADGGP